MATAKLREHTQLYMLLPELLPSLMYEDRTFGNLPSDPVIDSLMELKRVGVLGRGADGMFYKVWDTATRARSSWSRCCVCVMATALCA